MEYIHSENSKLIVGISMGIVIIPLSFVFRRLIVFAVKLLRRNSISCKKAVFDQCFFLYLLLIFTSCLIMGACIVKVENSITSDIWNLFISFSECFLLCVSISIVLSVMPFFSYLFRDNEDIDLVKFQTVKKSIGAFWAFGAYKAYYEIIFQELSDKMKEYENSGKHLHYRRLIIVCPLSCNIKGKLTDKDENIEEDDYTIEIQYDQGANMNRSYKIPVYKVRDHKNVYNLLIQYPSSLGTLWETKDSISSEIWQYHRSCFLETLKELLKDCPCTILEYDDTDVTHQEPLHKFILSKLNLKKDD